MTIAEANPLHSHKKEKELEKSVVIGVVIICSNDPCCESDSGFETLYCRNGTLLIKSIEDTEYLRIK